MMFYKEWGLFFEFLGALFELHFQAIAQAFTLHSRKAENQTKKVIFFETFAFEFELAMMLSVRSCFVLPIRNPSQACCMLWLQSGSLGLYR